MTSGLVSWDHLDLDEVLGEYTDDNEDRIGADLDSCTSEEEPQDEPHEKGARKEQDAQRSKRKAPHEKRRPKCIYVCPDCGREYQSVSGFRGHMVKKHSRSDLKAHMHKKNSGGESDVEPVVVQSKMPPCLPTELFSHAVHTGAENVYNEPRHRLPCSVNGSGVLKCAEIILGAGEAAMSEILYPRFGSIFSRNIINQAEREELFCRFHSLRMDTALRDDVVGLIQKLDANVPRKYCIMFHQCFLRELVACTIKACRELVTRPEETAASKDLTESEKGVLYYVAGFILHKVSTRKHGNTALIQSCVSKKGESRFAQWTAKLDRGGLKFPSDNFFELIYQCDRCVTSRVGTKLSPKVLCKDSTMEALMDHPQIQHVWDKICTSAGETYANSLVTLQYTLEAFLAMKGTALAQQARAPLMRTGKATNLSLRHGLLIN